jgi:hypothetical protein
MNDNHIAELATDLAAHARVESRSEYHDRLDRVLDKVSKMASRGKRDRSVLSRLSMRYGLDAHRISMMGRQITEETVREIRSTIGN